MRLCVVARQVSMDMSSEKAAELLASYDKDGSGLMELDEFQELCIALNRLNLNLAGTIDEKDMKAAELWSAFNRFDSNHSGKLDARELRKALATVKVEMDSAQAEELIAKYDKDQSGLMEFDEFEKLCTALEAVNVKLASTGDDTPKRRKRRGAPSKTGEDTNGTGTAAIKPGMGIGERVKGVAVQVAGTFKLPPTDEASVARRAAEERLKAAMPTVFQPGYSQNLSEAIDAARAVGVDPDKLAAAEAALATLQEGALVSEVAAKAKAEADAVKAAEAKLKAAMPYPFQHASSAKLKPALEAARASEVVPEALLASAESALQATLEHDQRENARAAEAALKAAMPLPFQRADPAKLKPAIAEAKKAGAPEAAITNAETKLAEAMAYARNEAEKGYDAKKAKQEAAAAKTAAAEAKVQAAVRAKEEAAAAKVAAAKAKEEAKAEADEMAKVAIEAKDKAAAEAEAKAKEAGAIKAAEAKLKAVMPYPFQLADAAKLRPAIEAAKKAGVSGPTVEAAEAKLKEAEDKAKKAADAQEQVEAEQAARTRAEEAKSKAEEAKSKAEAAARLKLVDDQDKELRAAFDNFDRNRSGKLDHKELRKALAAISMEIDSVQAADLVAKYDKDQSGLMEFDEFKELAMNLRAVNVSFDGAKAPPKKTKKLPASSASSTPMLASKLSEEETGSAKPTPKAAPAKTARDDDQYDYYGSGDEAEDPAAAGESDKNPDPADDDEYEYYDGEDEVVPVVKK